jgi:hypothetical protein
MGAHGVDNRYLISPHVRKHVRRNIGGAWPLLRLYIPTENPPPQRHHHHRPPIQVDLKLHAAHDAVRTQPLFQALRPQAVHAITIELLPVLFFTGDIVFQQVVPGAWV